MLRGGALLSSVGAVMVPLLLIGNTPAVLITLALVTAVWLFFQGQFVKHHDNETWGQVIVRGLGTFLLLNGTAYETTHYITTQLLSKFGQHPVNYVLALVLAAFVGLATSGLAHRAWNGFWHKIGVEKFVLTQEDGRAAAHNVSIDVLEKLYWLNRLGVAVSPVIRNETDGSVLTLEEALQWLRKDKGRLASFEYIPSAEFLFGKQGEFQFLPEEEVLRVAVMSLEEIFTIHLTEISEEEWSQPQSNTLKLIMMQVAEVPKIMAALKERQEQLSVLKKPLDEHFIEDELSRDFAFVSMRLLVARTLIFQGLRASAQEQITHGIQKAKMSLARYGATQFQHEIATLRKHLLVMEEIDQALKTRWDSLVVETQASVSPPTSPAVFAAKTILESHLPDPFIVTGLEHHQVIASNFLKKPRFDVAVKASGEFPWSLRMDIGISSDIPLQGVRLLLTRLDKLERSITQPLFLAQTGSYLAYFHGLVPGRYRLDVAKDQTGSFNTSAGTPAPHTGSAEEEVSRARHPHRGPGAPKYRTLLQAA